MFLQVFQKYVPSVFIVFVRMLQVFYLDVSKVDLVLQQVLHIHVSSVFRHILLSVLHLDVSKVDQMLHLSPRFFCCIASVSLPPSMPDGHSPPLLLFLDTGDARADVGPTWAREMAWETTYRCGHPDSLSVGTLVIRNGNACKPLIELCFVVV
jgi:hypothetical protein